MARNKEVLVENIRTIVHDDIQRASSLAVEICARSMHELFGPVDAEWKVPFPPGENPCTRVSLTQALYGISRLGSETPTDQSMFLSRIVAEVTLLNVQEGTSNG